jgi:hypothetical protein
MFEKKKWCSSPPLSRPHPTKAIPLINPLPPKVIPLISPDLRCTEIVK